MDNKLHQAVTEAYIWYKIMPGEEEYFGVLDVQKDDEYLPVVVEGTTVKIGNGDPLNGQLHSSGKEEVTGRMRAKVEQLSSGETDISIRSLHARARLVALRTQRVEESFEMYKLGSDIVQPNAKTDLELYDDIQHLDEFDDIFNKLIPLDENAKVLIGIIVALRVLNYPILKVDPSIVSYVNGRLNANRSNTSPTVELWNFLQNELTDHPNYFDKLYAEAQREPVYIRNVKAIAKYFVRGDAIEYAISIGYGIYLLKALRSL